MLFLGTLFHVKITRTGADFTIGIQFASRILGAMTQWCYIGTRDIWSRVIRSPYCTTVKTVQQQTPCTGGQARVSQRLGIVCEAPSGSGHMITSKPSRLNSLT